MLFASIFLTMVAAPVFSGSYHGEKYKKQEYSQGNPRENQTNRAILAWLVVLNKNEIAAAELAFQKNGNRAVEKYARWLHQQHSQNLKQTYNLSREIGEPKHTTLSASLKKEGQQEMRSLRPLAGKQFDRAYINGMVEGHREALNKMSSLMKDTDNSRLEKQIRITRAMVSNHLKKGVEIKHRLGY